MSAKFESLYLEVTVGDTLLGVQRLGPEKKVHADGIYKMASQQQKAQAVLIFIAAEAAALKRCENYIGEDNHG